MKHTDKLYLIKYATQQEPSTWDNLKGFFPHVQQQVSNLGDGIANTYKDIKYIANNNNLSAKQWLGIGDSTLKGVNQNFNNMLVNPAVNILKTTGDGIRQMWNEPVATTKAIGNFASNQAQKAYDNPYEFGKGVVHAGLDVGTYAKHPLIAAGSGLLNSALYAGEGKYNDATLAGVSGLTMGGFRYAKPALNTGVNVAKTGIGKTLGNTAYVGGSGLLSANEKPKPPVDTTPTNTGSISTASASNTFGK